MDEPHDQVPWDRLTEGAVDAVCHVIERLAAGHTGEIHLLCNEGGVRNVRSITDYKPGARSVSVAEFERAG